MFPYSPPAIYITDRVQSSQAVGRMNRMLASIQGPEPSRVTDEELNELIGQIRSQSHGRTGAIRGEEDPFLVFNAFSWEKKDALKEKFARFPHLSGQMLLGQGAWGWRDASSCLKRWGGVCQSAYEIHSIYGCLHSCQYCHIGSIVNVMLNLEEWSDRLQKQFERWEQKLYKYDNQSDTLLFEPEYGASELLVPLFARTRDKYLLLYTKSDNVEHLLTLDPGGHTLINWSLSSETVSRVIEKGAPAVERRIQAARQCQEAGYRVRFRISPLVPIRGWQEEYRAMIECLFENLTPDLITLDVLGWMTADSLEQCMDCALLDEEALNSLYADPQGPPFSPHGKQLFHHDFREKAYYRFLLQEIRSHDATVPVSLCMETPEMWERLGPSLGMSPSNYVCCCGPHSVP